MPFHCPFDRRATIWIIVLAILAPGIGPSGDGAELPSMSPRLTSIFSGSENPEATGDLREMQGYVRKLADFVIERTVSVQIGSAFGSGVIVSEKGLILTAAHVSGSPGRAALIRLQDGRLVRGESLGLNRPLDAGMIRITDPGPWPFLKVGNSDRVKKGQWVAATGHPGGYEPNRGPVFRLGRVLEVMRDGSLLRTDCQLAGGDSGGPLVDMRGRVVGIHSRIGVSLANNLHVPTSAYRENWDALVSKTIEPGSSYIGVQGEARASDARVVSVTKDSPAARAGMQAGDVIVRFGGQPVRSFNELIHLVQLRKPGESVSLEFKRDGNSQQATIRIGDRTENHS